MAWLAVPRACRALGASRTNVRPWTEFWLARWNDPCVLFLNDAGTRAPRSGSREQTGTLADRGGKSKARGRLCVSLSAGRARGRGRRSPSVQHCACFSQRWLAGAGGQQRRRSSCSSASSATGTRRPNIGANFAKTLTQAYSNAAISARRGVSIPGAASFRDWRFSLATG
jgi:hypothetical protein